jgi:hypothetical protein
LGYGSVSIFFVMAFGGLSILEVDTVPSGRFDQIAGVPLKLQVFCHQQLFFHFYRIYLVSRI